VTNGVSAWPPDGNPAGDRDEPAAGRGGEEFERATRAMTPAYVRLAHVRPAGRVRSEHVPPRRAASSRGGPTTQRPEAVDSVHGTLLARFARDWGFGCEAEIEVGGAPVGSASR
jgi:hypothetical protein